MKFFLILSFISLTLWACDHPVISHDLNYQCEINQVKSGLIDEETINKPDSSITPQNILTHPDAEKILGEPSQLTDSATKASEKVSTYGCAYSAISEDKKTGKKGNVYFLFEQYPDVQSAQAKYAYIKTANENHDGIKVLKDVGDEAYFHSDGQNFFFIMARKGTRVFNMKVNKITGNTSIDEFHRVARKIVSVI